jgi:hypothetical protein
MNYLINNPAGSHSRTRTQPVHALHSDDTTQSTLIACDVCVDGVTDGDCASVAVTLLVPV